MKTHGRPNWWLAVVVAVGMTVMAAGVAQAGAIKVPEGFGRWRLGDPGEPDGGKNRRNLVDGAATLIPVATPYGMLTLSYSKDRLFFLWLWANK